MYPSLLTALALVAGAPAAKDPPKKDTNPLLGEWTGEKAETGGMPLPVPVGGMTMEFKPDGKVVMTDAGKPPEEGGYKADPKKDPHEIDIVPPAAGGKVMTMLGIYKVDGDTLTVCLAAAGERPKKFESAAGQATLLLTFKRAKKKE
jgi:uncharacterized protein (TIGR03067 family)